jgi:hypothetical protein
MNALLAYDFEEVPPGTDYCLAVLDHMENVRRRPATSLLPSLESVGISNENPALAASWSGRARRDVVFAFHELRYQVWRRGSNCFNRLTSFSRSIIFSSRSTAISWNRSRSAIFSPSSA